MTMKMYRVVPREKIAAEGKRTASHSTFRIICNPNKEWDAKTAQEVEAFLKAKCQSVVSGNENVTVMIGGDGTIFHNKNEARGAIFAIGSERSKVCQANERNWKLVLENALKKIEAEERTALSVMINEKIVGWAINDAVVHSRRHNFIRLKVNVRGETAAFGGDGVVVATPTGSSGYAYSAGGFVLDKSYHMVEYVPICPHMRAAKPKLVALISEIEISTEGTADLVIDGQEIIELGKNDVVKVAGNRIVKFLKV